jgi:hypothetical protein
MFHFRGMDMKTHAQTLGHRLAVHTSVVSSIFSKEDRTVVRAKRLLPILTFVLSLTCCMPSLRATTIVGGGTGGGNAFPFGNNSLLYSGEYQQVYSSSLFNDPVQISQIAFASQEAQSYLLNLTLGLTTTAVAVNSLSTNYNNNKGVDFTTVFSGVQAVAATGTSTFDLVFNLSSPFNYNPASGNLLLDVFINSNGAVEPMFYVSGTSLDSSRVFNSGGNGAPTADSLSLETQFTVTSAVPEPSSGLLLLVGIGLMSGAAIISRAKAGPRSLTTCC